MDEQERLEVLENEFNKMKEDLQDILLKIRIFLMEAQSPLRSRTQDQIEQSDSDSVEELIESRG